MVKIKVEYLIENEKDMKLTTREWCNIHADRESLRKLLAEENNVSPERIVIRDNYSKIIEGELDFDNLDDRGVDYI